MVEIQSFCSIVVLAPLVGAIVAGLFGKQIGRAGAHWSAIIGVAISFISSLVVYSQVAKGLYFNGAVYSWLLAGQDTHFSLGFMIDKLSAVMMVVVNFVSLMVHIYTIGYMRDDPGYQRFFSYIALFTFSMLMLVMSNNFLQLFFGWEAVGLVSYLLIGFWYTKPSAIHANLKAFLVNRVGDFGFLLGIGLIFAYFGSLDYVVAFDLASKAPDQAIELIPGKNWSLISVICICLFVGAMGKSAQVPLHVWLPDSMEGPTPISALIHAATMVTAGIFMVARMSPLFELSETALSFVLIIGAITAISMALIAVVQYDIKRIIAYSTLSQLGYMVTALGVSAYSAAMFHLITHAFFKALLFLGAGSVIIALHHEQDIRKMGSLRTYMPITYIAVLIGSLAGAGIPPFAGFYSKDAIIDAVHSSGAFGAQFAYACVLSTVFITAFYSFRLLFVAFHGKSRLDAHAREHLHESPLVVTIPLVLLAIPSVISGALYIAPMLFENFFGQSIFVLHKHDVLGHMREHFINIFSFTAHSLLTAPFLFAIAGIGAAGYLYLIRTDLPEKIKQKLNLLYIILDSKYGFDEFYDRILARSTIVKLGQSLWKYVDIKLIDTLMVNGVAKLIERLASIIRFLQTGYIYHYAFAMILGIFILLTLWLSRAAMLP